MPRPVELDLRHAVIFEGVREFQGLGSWLVASQQRIRHPWLLPGLNALLLAALGVAINFATDLKTSWIAWCGVVMVALGTAAATVGLDRRGRDRDAADDKGMTSSSRGDLSEAIGLAVRTTELERADGSKMRTVEIFNDAVVALLASTAEAVGASQEMTSAPISSGGRPASASSPGQAANSGGLPSGAFPSLAPLLARAAHRTVALMIAGDPLKNKRLDEIDHPVGWLDLCSPRVPPGVPSAAIAATGLNASRRSSLISDAIGPSRRTPRAYVSPGIERVGLDEPGLLHLDMTGTCMNDHIHVTWEPVSADCGEVLLATQTLADVAADPDATWSPPPGSQAADAINGRTLQVMTIVGAALWAAAREGWDMRRAVEQFSQEYFPSVLSMCEDMVTQTGKGSGLCTRVAEFRDTPQQVLSGVVHDALDPLSDIIRAAQSGPNPARLDLSSWLSGTRLLAITVPEEPTIAQLGVVNALLGAADALGWTRPGYLPPTVAWEGVPSPRHGLSMLNPWWLGVFDDAAQFLIWSELLNTQTPQHGCDWLIGAGTHEALLVRLAQDTTPPSGDQRVLVHSDTDTFLLLD